MPRFRGVVAVFENSFAKKIADSPHNAEAHFLVVAPDFSDTSSIITLLVNFISIFFLAIFKV